MSESPEMSASPVKAGDMLAGKYRVERLLGMGNMGVVVAATHVALKQRVALKFMLPTKAAAQEQFARFLREAQAAVRLRSQHVARVSDVGTLESGAPYMVMELLDGRDLAAELEERGQLPIAEAVDYVLQACEAVAEAHASGIVHRDIKPANLFLAKGLDGKPCVKVLDFGISKHANEAKLTQEEAVLGSPLYMSPEQIKASATVDARSDVWALGVVLYELIAGRTPFQAERVLELITKIHFEPPTPLTKCRPDAPFALDALLAQCFEKERDRRVPSVAALAAALVPFGSAPHAAIYAERVAAVLGEQVAPARPTAVLPPEAAPRPEQGSSPAVGGTVNALTRSSITTAPTRPKRAWMLVAAALALGGVAVGGVWVMRGRTAPEPSLGADAPASVSAPAMPQASAKGPAPPAGSSSAPVDAPAVEPPTVSPAASATIAPMASSFRPKVAPARTKAKVTGPLAPMQRPAANPASAPEGPRK